MTVSIRRFEPVDDALIVTWEDGSRDSFPWLWLRDHCRCPASLHPETLQRLVDTVGLPADLRARRVSLAENGRAIEVTWPNDGHLSRFEASFLHTMARPDQPRRPNQPWDGTSFAGDYPTVAHDAVLAEDDALSDLLDAIERHGFVFVDGVPTELTATRRLAERIGYLRETIFGSLWDFTADLKHSDTAYTNLDISLHTDGTYAVDPPGLQLFHCLQFDGSGGESILVDGFKACVDLKKQNPEAYQLLTRIEVPAQYIEDGVHLLARHPVIGLDEAGAVVRVCYNNHDRAPFLPPAGTAAAFMKAVRAFGRLLAERPRQQRFTLEPGRVLIFDNWRILHARTAYQGRRRLAGCYINREDFESRLRVLRGP